MRLWEVAALSSGIAAHRLSRVSLASFRWPLGQGVNKKRVIARQRCPRETQRSRSQQQADRNGTITRPATSQTREEIPASRPFFASQQLAVNRHAPRRDSGGGVDRIPQSGESGGRASLADAPWRRIASDHMDVERWDLVDPQHPVVVEIRLLNATFLGAFAERSS